MNLPFQRVGVWMLLIVTVTMLVAGAVQMEWIPAPEEVRAIAGSGRFRAVMFGVVMLSAIVWTLMDNALRAKAVAAGGHLCPKCQYVVRVEVGNRCPECGTVFDSKLIRSWNAWVYKSQMPPIGVVLYRAGRGVVRWVWGRVRGRG